MNKFDEKRIKYTDKGYSYVEVTLPEVYRWGGLGFCDKCNREFLFTKGNEYLIFILNRCYCEDCFKGFLKTSVRYEEDIYQQNECHVAYYKAYLDKKN